MITTLTLWRYRDIYSYDALLSFRELKVRMTINMELKILNLDWLLEKLFFFLSLYPYTIIMCLPMNYQRNEFHITLNIIQHWNIWSENMWWHWENIFLSLVSLMKIILRSRRYCNIAFFRSNYRNTRQKNILVLLSPYKVS